ncbi:hypothetical protein E4U42_002744 [Claviceps africana]|uniref:Peptidase S54 rhomboid domain-containing protein n=1 Tax=Claviceps africana TaxID=83212 RepID=A0A8K0NLX9_9HYPO|nr:hypothetical protein E4U42_002744 [Claviceps africana]
MNVLSMGSAPCVFLRAASRRVAAMTTTTTTTTTTTLKDKGGMRFATRWLSKSICSPSGPSSASFLPYASTTRMRPAPGSMHHPPCIRHRMIFSASKPRILRHYEDVPKDYRDQTGLPFGPRDLADDEIARVFGRGMDSAAGNRLLRILHGRRVAGTLEDPAFMVHTAQYPDQLIASGLEYLRQNVPVNEVLNAGLRAEDELNQMDREMAEREARDKSDEDARGVGSDAPVTAPADPVYGQSAFDQIRARNVARQKALDRAAEEQRLAREAALAVGVAGPLAKRGEDGARAITNPKVREYYDKAQSDLEAPPDLKAWERILPSATLVALVLGFLGAVAAVYDEPTPRYRLLRDVSTAHATVGTLIALNALVFLGWRVPPLWAAFNKYMIFVVATVKPVTLFTAVFSHKQFKHVLANMVPLWFVGTALHDELGRAEFLTLYLGCGALGFLGSLVTYTLRGWLTVTSLGASGATLGLCSAYFWEHRTDGFRILGLPPDGVHGIVFLALMMAMQLAAFGSTIKLRVDIASHLSGMVAGILGIEVLHRIAPRRTRPGDGDGDVPASREVIEVWGAGK